MLDKFFKVQKRKRLMFFLVIMVITAVSVVITEYDAGKGFMGFYKALKWAFANFYPDAQALSKMTAIMIKLRETFLMSVAATTTAAILASLFALLGSTTTQINNFLSKISRAFASVLRNIPLVAWAMVLLFTFGQSSLTGFLALFFATFGFLVRAFMETFDEVSASAVEALRASGASYGQIVFQAVFPASLPQMLSWVLYMIETNIRDATLLGILTGTGIGFSFNLYFRSMNYHAASLVVIVIVFTVFLIEYLSNYVRREIL
ncbi:ABC transporter permease subunit [Thermanaerosceptrum fracticalcis]|uniref:ABC transporter permease subunit n=1 Tax=Thermanaerosceptrum fracticalcis TaxID=1712410 RepID=A0A7G6E829_THEFR|nr:ABC transporter permease subunit [Thermanaerosceptrum fracticalcis]QNB48233.1 ABC transporter permease subunit [Thermanaerosceptrum fracticalcis]